MHVNKMTREDFEKVPWRNGIFSEEKEFYSLVVIPKDEIHDSGYRCMDFVSVSKDGEPMVRLSGCSDVLHINGIGGYGHWKPNTGIPNKITPVAWSVDCLKESGYIRLFSDRPLTCGHVLSSFEIFAEEEKGE